MNHPFNRQLAKLLAATSFALCPAGCEEHDSDTGSIPHNQLGGGTSELRSEERIRAQLERDISKLERSLEGQGTVVELEQAIRDAEAQIAELTEEIRNLDSETQEIEKEILQLK